MIQSGNLFAAIPLMVESEQFIDLVSMPGMRVGRIVSTGQATPASQWLDQDWTEWVVLLSGAAGIQMEGEADIRTLGPGDWLLIPAHARHRVEWSDMGGPTVWLAVHAGSAAPPSA